MYVSQTTKRDNHEGVSWFPTSWLLRTTPVCFFFAMLSSGTAWAFPWAGFVCSTSALAAGPFVALVVGLFRDEAERAGAVGEAEDGGLPPPSPPALRGIDSTAAAAADDDEDDEEAEAPALSRVHSSLWPARHAALWQASLQYFRCRHPEQRRSCRSWAGVSQNAHEAAWLLMMRAYSWSNIRKCDLRLGESKEWVWFSPPNFRLGREDCT